MAVTCRLSGAYLLFSSIFVIKTSQHLALRRRLNKAKLHMLSSHCSY
jgi:hypothetical protein